MVTSFFFATVDNKKKTIRALSYRTGYDPSSIESKYADLLTYKHLDQFMTNQSSISVLSIEKFSQTKYDLLKLKRSNQ